MGNIATEIAAALKPRAPPTPCTSTAKDIEDHRLSSHLPLQVVVPTLYGRVGPRRSAELGETPVIEFVLMRLSMVLPLARPSDADVWMYWRFQFCPPQPSCT